jgi:tetratricopeptide (TPR) repeat protein
MMSGAWEDHVIEIYDINNGKLKYSAYTFWQLCDMVTEDFAYHTGDWENDILCWIEEKARGLCAGTKRTQVLKRLAELLQFGKKQEDRTFASRVSLLLAAMAAEQGDNEAAIRHSEAAVRLSPDHVEAYHQLARGLSAAGEYERAAEAWQRAKGILPSEEAYLSLAEVLGKLKRPGHQERVLRSLVKNQPRSIKGMDALAQFYRLRNENQAAARLAQHIVDLRPAKGEQREPLFYEFAEALIWSKYSYEARKVNALLEFLDEEQNRNPHEWLALLKAILLYKLDRRLCQEECRYELGNYFQGIGYEEKLLEGDLREVSDVFGQEFCTDVVPFVRDQFARGLPPEKRGTSVPPSPRLPRELTSRHPATPQDRNQKPRRQGRP